MRKSDLTTDPYDKGLVALQDSKDRALERLKGISNWYTTAAEDPDQPPYYKYTLRGVSASSDTVYVFDRGLHMNSETDAWHWWKLSYTQGDAKPVSQMVGLEQVTRRFDLTGLTICVLMLESSRS